MHTHSHICTHILTLTLQHTHTHTYTHRQISDPSYTSSLKPLPLPSPHAHTHRCLCVCLGCMIGRLSARSTKHQEQRTSSPDHNERIVSQQLLAMAHTDRRTDGHAKGWSNGQTDIHDTEEETVGGI